MDIMNANLTSDNTGFYQVLMPQGESINFDPLYCYNNWSYWYQHPQYITIDKTKQAFAIIKVLQNKKIIKLTTVKSFIDLVDEIIKVL